MRAVFGLVSTVRSSCTSMAGCVRHRRLLPDESDSWRFREEHVLVAARRSYICVSSCVADEDQTTMQIDNGRKKSEIVTRHLPIRLCTVKARLEENVIQHKRAGGSSVNIKRVCRRLYTRRMYGYSASPDGNQSWWRRAREHLVELQGKAYVDHTDMYAVIFQIYAGHTSPLTGALSV